MSEGQTFRNEQETRSLLHSFQKKAAVVHGKTPVLRGLPFSAVAIIALLIFINLIIWAAVGAVLHFNRHVFELDGESRQRVSGLIY